MEQRVSGLETDQEHCIGSIDLLKATISALKKTQTSQAQLELEGGRARETTAAHISPVGINKRLETIENQQRGSNFKINNLPEEANEIILDKVKAIIK